MSDQAINVDDIVETTNHFRCIDLVIDDAKNLLSEKMIKEFRRTMATRAIDKGMPIEQVQKILGHSQIDTTMQYAIVNQNNVKVSHRRYIA